MKKKSPYALIALGFASILMLRDVPVLDQPGTFLAYSGSFLLFLFFLCGMMGIGQKLESKLIQDPASNFGIHLLLGSALISVLIGFITLLVPIESIKPVFFLMTAYGCFHFEIKTLKWNWNESRWPNFLFVVLVISIVLRTIEGFHLSGHGDAFICYLTANRKLVSTGNFKTFLENPVYFFSSSWEYLYLWGNVFFFHGSNTGLAESQRFAQWCSALVAHAGLIGISYQFTQIFKLRKSWALITALSVSTIPVMRWMQNLAKNDYGIAFWGVGACLVLELAIRRKSEIKNKGIFFVSGILFGLTLIGKISTITIAIPVLMILIWKRVDLRFWIIMSLGGICGALPVVIRNYWLTKNPFFPWFNELFKSSTFGPSLQSTFTKLDPLHQNGVKSDYFLEPIVQQPWIAGLIVFVLIFVSFRKSRNEYQLKIVPWVVSSIVGWVFFAIFLRPRTEIRYLGPTLELASMMSVIAIAGISNGYKNKFTKILPVAFGVWVLVASNLSLFTFSQMFGEKYTKGSETVLGHSGGKAKKWLREHVKKDEKILSVADNEEYYMSDYHFHEMSYVSQLDRDLSSVDISEDIIGYLKISGYRYIYDNQNQMTWGNLNPIKASELLKVIRKTPVLLVYEDENAVIYDLERLK
jgi:hypothetical protein